MGGIGRLFLRKLRGLGRGVFPWSPERFEWCHILETTIIHSDVGLLSVFAFLAVLIIILLLLVSFLNFVFCFRVMVYCDAHIWKSRKGTLSYLLSLCECDLEWCFFFFLFFFFSVFFFLSSFILLPLFYCLFVLPFFIFFLEYGNIDDCYLLLGRYLTC